MFKLILIVALLVGYLPEYAQTDGYPPFEFKVDSITFSNGPVRLAGAFLKPNGNGPFPAVVMVHGAGSSTFDEPAFRIHANAFIHGGFAVLLYDKRGSGKSTGKLDTSDFNELSSDLAAGINYLRTRPEIIGDQIGILGRSEGGWVGTLAASRDPLIRFVILSSGSGVKPWIQTIYATKRGLREMGATEKEVEDATNAKEASWIYYGQVARMDSIQRTSIAMQERRDALLKQLHSFAQFAPQIPQTIRDPKTNPIEFFRAFTNKIEYDPTPAFRTGRAALLEVIGANDEVVDPASTIDAFEKLRQSGHEVSIHILEGVGHSLVETTKEGSRYPEGYPELTVDWARKVIDGIK